MVLGDDAGCRVDVCDEQDTQASQFIDLGYRDVFPSCVLLSQLSLTFRKWQDLFVCERSYQHEPFRSTTMAKETSEQCVVRTQFTLPHAYRYTGFKCQAIKSARGDCRSHHLVTSLLLRLEVSFSWHLGIVSKYLLSQ